MMSKQFLLRERPWLYALVKDDTSPFTVTLAAPALPDVRISYLHYPSSAYAGDKVVIELQIVNVLYAGYGWYKIVDVDTEGLIELYPGSPDPASQDSLPIGEDAFRTFTIWAKMPPHDLHGRVDTGHVE